MINKLRKYLLGFTMLCCSIPFLAQDSLAVIQQDFKYREDQFYAALTYNVILGLPSGISQSGVSGGIQFGFLRDMPFNKKRSLAFALGAGLALDRYNQNLFIGDNTEQSSLFIALDDAVNYNTNRFTTAAIEIPFQFRWRTSTPTQYKFWRIYTGVKFGYVYWYRSFFSQPNNEIGQTNIPEFNNLQMALNLSAGYSTFNFYVQYQLTPFFENAFLENTTQQIAFTPLKLGIIFYIL